MIVKQHIQAGTRLSKKVALDNRRFVRKIIEKGSVNNDGLVVVKTTLPMDIKPVEQIVVPPP